MTPIHLNHPTSSSATTVPILEYKDDHSNLQLLSTQTINRPSPPSSSFLSLHAHEHAHTIEPIQAPVAKDEKFTFHGEGEINPHGSALWSEQTGNDGNESQNSSNLLLGAGEIIKPNCRKSSGSSKKYSSNYLSTASDSKTGNYLSTASDTKTGNSKYPVESKPRVRVVHRFRGDHDRGNYNKNMSNVRECSDCHTTATPLWRSGPQGPKSLCNACGIRQRKARRAMEAAAAAARTNNHATALSNKERELTHDSHLLPYKKRGKLLNIANASANGTATNFHQAKKVASSLDDDSSSSASCLSKDLDSQPRAFPRDEEEAAVLLMALSCGLA